MDLILGLPGENLADVKDSLEKVLALNPDDITLHALAIKRGSQLQTQIADEINTLEDFDLPSEDEVRKMGDVAEKMLRAKNYLPYYLYRQGYISGQIENIGYCKRGAEGIYNVQIMDERQTILGIGAAATTKVPDNENLRLQTSFNAKDLITYLRDVDKYIDNRSNVLAEIYTPIVETVEQPAEEIVEQPVTEVVEQPAVEVVEQPAAEVVEQPAVEIVAQPAVEVVEQPAAEVVEQPAVETVEQPAAEIVEQPATETVEEPVEEIVEQPVEEIVEQPVEEIVEQPAVEVVEKPVEEKKSKNKSKKNRKNGGKK